jgi:membrane-bound inhibitor of C-type lysozyme
MRELVLVFEFVAVLVTCVGCSPPQPTPRSRSETGQGTFVSTNGQAVAAAYWSDGTVTLLFPDHRRVELYRAISGSGARYTNSTAEWWEHQDEASYAVDGTNVFRGRKR